MNQSILLGRITKDIEIHYSAKGVAVAKTDIAVNNRQSSNDEVLFIELVFFDRLGEIANQYLRKGSKICVQGRIVLDKYVTQSGDKRQKHKIIVHNMEMIDTKRNDSAPVTDNSDADKYMSNMPKVEIDINEDEIPF